MSARSSGAEALAARGVGRRFGRDVVALAEIELAFQAGLTIGIIGNNGSGKSTLLRLWAGNGRPSEGSVEVCGDDPEKDKNLRARIGYVAQSSVLDPEMTGRETLRLFANLYSLTWDEATVISRFGLEPVIDRRVSEYSGGFRQRLHLTVGFLHDPEVLLLDEPTNRLDREGKRALWDMISERKSHGRITVVVSHDLGDVAKHCAEVVMLHHGRLVAAGEPEEIVRKHGFWTLRVDGKIVRQVSSREEALAAKDELLTSPDHDFLGFHLTEPSLESAFETLTGDRFEAKREPRERGRRK
jgi:ABC-type multidrug transport system ATPase subunit